MELAWHAEYLVHPKKQFRRRLDQRSAQWCSAKSVQHPGSQLVNRALLPLLKRNAKVEFDTSSREAHLDIARGEPHLGGFMAHKFQRLPLNDSLRLCGLQDSISMPRGTSSREKQNMCDDGGPSASLPLWASNT